MALSADVAVDDARLRAERRARCFAEMDRAGVDVLLLGREANARYVSGAARLWLAGTRPFAPGCVVVRSTQEVHLLSTSDAGVPPEIPPAHLFPISWNPLNLVEALKAIDGVADAAVVGVDGMTPLFAQLLPLAAPIAEIVDGDATLRAARRVKTDDEIACIRRAISIAEAALAATAAAIVPGVRERSLLATFERRMTDFGVTAPAREGTFCVTPRRAANDAMAPLRQLVGDGSVSDGDLVALASGVLFKGYEGSVARTATCGTRREARQLRERSRAARDAMVIACRAGRAGADVRRAYTATGEGAVPVPLLHGVGLGFELPVLAGDGVATNEEWTLAPGMVLAVQSYAWQDGVGGHLGQDVVVVTDGDPVLLTTLADDLS
jgi:Xaa-Pro aminopeptidase